MRYLISLLAPCVLSACAGLAVPTTPQWDSRFGVDTRMALTQQILHPQAGRNGDAVNGMDGRSARAAYERYQKNAGEPQQQAPIIASGVK